MLPDQRAWELVSPPNKQGATVDPLGEGQQGPLGGLVQASEDGTAFAFSATAPIEREAEGNRAPEGIQVLSSRGTNSRGEPGWSSQDIITLHEKAEGLPSGKPDEYRLFSPDLSLAVVEPFGRPPKTSEEEPPSKFQEPPLAGTEREERGIYLRHRAGCEPVVKSPRCFQPLVVEKGKPGENDTAGTPFGEKLQFVSASQDLSHIVLRSAVALTPIPAGYPFEEYLYEWNKDNPAQLQLVSEPPSGSGVSGSPQLGNEDASVFQSVRGAVSNSKVYWTSFENGSEVSGLFLFARDTTTGVTIQVNRPVGSVKEIPPEKLREKEPELRFQAAAELPNGEGSRVFFTDSVGLTEESPFKIKKAGPTDLYVCELPPALAASSTCTLRDLSVAPPNERTGKPQAAEVIGTVPAISQDGSTVAFVANVALTGEEESPNHEKAVKGSCQRPNGPEPKRRNPLCNLYVVHFESGKWGKPKLVAVLSQEDQHDWAAAAGLETFLWHLTARLSPNGRYLTFMSNRSLTGFNNVDANSGKRDQEVFLYDGQGGHEALACPSCNRSGRQPTGVLDKAAAEGGEPQGLLVDPFGFEFNETGEAKLGQGMWLAGSLPGWTPLATTASPYQSRYLLDNGRLFFNSADSLVPAFEGQVTEREAVAEGKKVKAGVENVYEYEPQGVGTCSQAGGCVSLISAGTSTQESAFLDASTTGEDVFFLTSDKLVPSDVDTNFDAYDARVCTQTSPCVTPTPPTKPECEGEAGCKGAPAPKPGFLGGGTGTFTGPGNVPRQETLPLKVVISKPKPLTRAQLLAKALSSCRKKHKHAKKKRAACERQARKKYGSAKHKSGKKK